MKTELLIDYNEAEKDLWKNGVGEDCLSFIDVDITIKILNIPLRIKQAIQRCLEATQDT